MTEDLSRGGAAAPGSDGARGTRGQPTATQAGYLARGLDQPGGKLPLFDRQGQLYPTRTIRGCIARGWAVPWFGNPIMPGWLVCRLTAAGRTAVLEARRGNVVALTDFRRLRARRAWAAHKVLA